ncbi:MAG: plasmid replication/partition related protein [Acidovorax sp.]|nr:plasmid replication/partition related protein [Acidovorax sp.]
MNIVVNEELKAYIEPLTPDEHEALERSILTEGCRDALVLWGDVLVDGHNRYGICQKHGLPFQTVQNPRFQSMEDVHLWMIDQHLGRRSVSDFQRGVLALRKREIVADRRARAASAPDDAGASGESASSASPAATAAGLPAADPLNSREAIAKAARLSSSQVVMIEKIQKQAAPELVAAVKSGTISINAAAAVATLPAEEQVAAVAAGKDELKQAAKRVRDLKRKPPREDAPKNAAATDADETAVENNSSNSNNHSSAEMQRLRQQIADLTAENAELRRQLAQLSPADQPF